MKKYLLLLLSLASVCHGSWWEVQNYGISGHTINAEPLTGNVSELKDKCISAEGCVAFQVDAKTGNGWLKNSIQDQEAGSSTLYLIVADVAPIANTSFISLLGDKMYTGVGATLHNQGNYSPGTPNVTVTAIGQTTTSNSPAVQMFWLDSSLTESSPARFIYSSGVWGSGSLHTARHIEALDANIVTYTDPSATDAINIVEYPSSLCSVGISHCCSISGWASADSIPHPNLIKNLNYCQFAQIDFQNPSSIVRYNRMFQLSDDGEVAHILISSNDKATLLSLNQKNGQVDSYNTQWDAGTDAENFVSLSTSHDGRFTLIAVEDKFRVYDLQSRAVRGTAQLSNPSKQPVHICPMGVFVILGGSEASSATLYRWNGTSNDYGITHTFMASNSLSSSSSTPSSIQSNRSWTFHQAVTSVNGEDPNPDGCLVFIVWTSTDEDKSAIKVDMYSMLTYKHYVQVEYEFRDSTGPIEVVSVNMHLEYASVAVRGAQGQDPSVFVFSAYTQSKPVAILPSSDVTSISPYAHDMVVVPKTQPVLDDEDEPFVPAPDFDGDLITLTTAGKGGIFIGTVAIMK